MRDFGSMQSPMNAYMLNLGLESLHVRMQRHCENGMAVAKFLESHPKVAYVNYCGLPSQPLPCTGAEVSAQRQLRRGVSFGWRRPRSCQHLYEGTEACRHRDPCGRCPHLLPEPGDSSTHRQMNDEQLTAAGVPAELVRMSCGLESAEDLIARYRTGTG